MIKRSKGRIIADIAITLAATLIAAVGIFYRSQVTMLIAMAILIVLWVFE